MKIKKWAILLLTSLILINCGENDIEKIGLKDAIFKASGNNPKWLLEIDSNNGIHFYSNSELGKIITLDSKRNDVIDSGIISFDAEKDANKITIEIYRKQCIDSHKNKEFKYEVKLNVEQLNQKGFLIFKGCGEFTSNF
jgi:uncharacterized membrane protein